MNRKTLITLSFFLWPFLFAQGVIGYPQEDPSLARVQRLLMASVMDLPVDQWLADMDATGYQDFPAYIRFLEDETRPYNNYNYHILMPFICKIDGSNMRSTGDSDVLRLTREFLTVKSDNPDWQSAAYCLLYLSQKGVSSDLPLLEKYSELPSNLDFAKQSALESFRVLQGRVAGTNMLTFLQTRYYHWSTNKPPFQPSVANTGPQSAYVYDLLKQALAKYGDATNIPPELITMRVSFNADGSPVCNVELEKYGLTMPGLPPPPLSAITNISAEARSQTTVTVPVKADGLYVAEPSVEPPSWLRPVVPFAVGAGVLAALFLWRCILKRKS